MIKYNGIGYDNMHHYAHVFTTAITTGDIYNWYFFYYHHFKYYQYYYRHQYHIVILKDVCDMSA